MSSTTSTSAAATATSAAASATDTCRYAAIHYKPNGIVNIIVGAAFILLCVVFCVHQLRWRKVGVPGWKWAWVLPAGCFVSGMGYFIRTRVDPCAFKIGTFIGQQLFIILSPCFFIAFNYAIFGRFITALQKPQLCWIRPDKVSKIFIWSDVITFIIQGGAGGMQASQGSMAKWGTRAFLIGVSLQTLSFLLFGSLVFTAHRRAMANQSRHLSSLGIRVTRHARQLFWAFEATNVLYLIRCTYRVLEYAFGTDSFLMKAEGWLIGLDAAPIILALSIWLVIYPLKSLFEIGGEANGDDAISCPMTAGLVPISSDSYSKASAPYVHRGYA